MKKIRNIQKTSFLKKIFIKFCRIFRYEIIDQANFRSPTLNKSLNETLSVPGEKSITIPLGLIKITRKIREPMFPNIEEIAFKTILPITPPKLLLKYNSPIEQKQIIKKIELIILTKFFINELYGSS